jgi:hypothetical protein
LKDFVFFKSIFRRLYFCMVKHLCFHNSSFALRNILMSMTIPQCDIPLLFKEYEQKPSLSCALWFMYVRIHDNICLMLYYGWSFTHKWWAFPKCKAKLNYVLSCFRPLSLQMHLCNDIGALPSTYGIGERLFKSCQLWVAIIQVIYACMYVYTYICILWEIYSCLTFAFLNLPSLASLKWLQQRE